MSLKKFFLALGPCLLFTALLFSQGTDLGTIRGTVTDSSGAVVPNANVEITDLATSFAVRVMTDAAGNFEASSLRSGTYKVAVSMSGFSTAEVLNIVLRPGQAVRADAQLRPKTATETVVITSEAPLVASESTTVAGTIENRTLLEIPRDSRDIYSFLYLNPNITQSQSDGSLKFLGAQSYGASFSLDGQRSNGGVFGQPTASQPSLETVGELTVLSNNFTAEYAGIANIRVTTRRGESQVHGSLFHNNKNSGLAAWDLRDKIGQAAFLPTPAQSKYPNPYFNLNEFGGSFGGPLPKVKNTYFFAAYEKQFFNRPVNLRSTSLPHPTLWKGDFSLLADSRKPVVPAGVTLTAAEVGSDTVGGQGQRFIRIPQRLLNPATAKLLELYFPQVNPGAPINATNGRLVDFFNSMPGVIRRDLGTIRFDHDFSERDRFYAVYNAQGATQRTAAVVSPYVGLGLTLNERTNHTLSLSHTHLWGTTLVNELRGGFNRQPTFRRSNQTLREFLQKIGFDQSDLDAYGKVIGPAALDTYGHMAVNFGSGFSTFSNGGRNTFRPLDQELLTIGNTLSWIKGRHSIKAGADFVRNSALDGFTSGRGNPRGLVTYTGGGIDGFARYLMGMPANTVSFVNAFRPPMDVHNWEQGFFVLDDWKIHPRLTLNFGLRYELITSFVEANDLLVNFDPDYRDPSGKRGRFVVPSQQTIASLDSRIVDYGVVTAEKLDLPRSLVRTDKNNFAPRVGAAWRFADKMVLRGGYGFFYPTSAAQGIRDPLATNAFQQGLTKRNDPAGPLSAWPGFAHGFSPLTGGVLNLITGQPSVNAVAYDLQSPRIEQYNLTFERELGWQTAVRFSYLGTRMHGLTSIVDLNMIPPSDTPWGASIGDGVTACDPDEGDCDISDADRARLPFPLLGDYLGRVDNYGDGRSHAFQAEVNRRFAGGLSLNATYTLLDQNSTAPDTGNSSLGGTAYNQFNPERDRGEDAFLSRQRFISYGIYQLPVGRGRKFGTQMNNAADAAIGGWELSWQMFAKTGAGFTPFWRCDNCNGVYPGNVASSFTDATGAFYDLTYRPIVSGQGQVASGDRIFNPDAFGPPPLGADLFDNPNVAVRHLLRGPGTWGVNLGVHKVFRLGERVRAQLGADFNNLFNHPLKSPDNYDIGNLGSFAVRVDPKTLKLGRGEVTPNPDFGRLITSYPQESIDSRRTVRLRLRITF